MGCTQIRPRVRRGPFGGLAAAGFIIYVVPTATLVVTILVGCPVLFFLAPSVGRKFMLAAACFMVLAYIGIAYLKHSTSGRLSPFYEIISTWMILTSGALWVLMRRPIVVEWSKKARESRASKKRRNAGLCVNCGYNLHGLTRPRCPECGRGFEFTRPHSKA